MFRRPFAINQTHKVSGADRKKIRRSIEKVLQLSTSVEGSNLLEQLLPAKSGDLELAKLPAPSRLVIYLLNGCPILLDTSGKSDYVPTVMGLWSCPQLLPQVTVKHAAVSRYILSGADLMLPGVDMSSLPHFKKGQLLSICVPGNPSPIAVGTALMDSTAAATQAAGQGKGRIVELLQYYGDTLWHSLGGAAVPNAGFVEGLVLPVDNEAVSVEQQQTYLGTDHSEAAAAAHGVQELSLQGHTSSSNDSNSIVAAAVAGDAAAGLGAASAAAAATTSSSSISSPEDMDLLLEMALLQALHKTVKDDDMPLNSSTLWSQHITHCRPPGTTLDVKKSTHKKMKAFMQAYSKTGLIKVREDKHSGDMILTGVSRDHELYHQFTPYRLGSGSSAAAAAGDGSGILSSAAGVGGDNGSAPHAPLVVEEVFRPSSEVKPVFQAVGADPSGVYTAAAAADVAFEYANTAQLDVMAPDNKTLVLDAVLCDALYKGLIKKGELYPTHIPKCELREAFLKRLHPQTCISRGDKYLIRRGAVPTVNISGERRQGNKYVTRVVGVEAFLVDPATLAAECQRKFACSSTVQSLPGKNNPGHEVILQGNIIDKLPEYLMQCYQIPKKYFLVKK